MKHILTRLSLVALMFSVSIGCAARQISGSPEGRSVLYVVVSGTQWDDGGDFEPGGGIGWRYEDEKHWYRAEAQYAQTEDGAGIESDTVQALVEASGKIDPGMIGRAPSGGRKHDLFVLTPFGGGGGRYAGRDQDTTGDDKTNIGSIYGHLGLDFSWWFNANMRFYLNVRGGASIFSYIDDTVQGVSTSESKFFGGGVARLELGYEMKSFHISLFSDYADFGENQELITTGLNVGWRW